MFDEKYPIASMAAKTGELEDAAKKHRAGGEVTKDAVALWSDQAVFGWDDPGILFRFFFIVFFFYICYFYKFFNAYFVFFYQFYLLCLDLKIGRAHV